MTLTSKWAEYRSTYIKILKLGCPVLAGQLGMIVVGFADNAMIGHYSTDSLAAASFVNNIFNIPILMTLGFTYGLTPLIGAMYSRGAGDDIGATLRRGMIVNLCFALLLTAVMGAVYLNLDRMGQPEHLLPIIRPYFLIYLAGIVPIALFQVYAQTSYAVNSTMMPMWIILGTNIFNVAGNYALIYGHFGLPEMGLTGAGISTLISRWLCPLAIILIFMTARRYRPYRRGLRIRGAVGERLGRIVKTSLPVSVQLGCETASFSIAAVMAGWLGSLQLASFQIMLTMGTLGFCVYYGMATAVSVLVSNAAGERDHRKMRHVAFAGYHIHICLAIAASAVFAIFGHQLIAIFTGDPAVEAMAITLIVPMVLYQLGDATQVNFANALRGTANVMPMLWIAVASYIVVGIPATYLIAFTLGLDIYGIVLSFSVSLFMAGALFLLFFLRSTSSKTPRHSQLVNQ